MMDEWGRSNNKAFLGEQIRVTFNAVGGQPELGRKI